MLGDGSRGWSRGRSFLVGHGREFPQQPHQRAASCPPAPATCNYLQLHSKDPNPNVLVGALVGGPFFNDSFPDDRMDYAKSEVVRGKRRRRRRSEEFRRKKGRREKNEKNHKKLSKTFKKKTLSLFLFISQGIEYNAGFTAALAGAAELSKDHPWGSCMQAGGLANWKEPAVRHGRGRGGG